MGTMRPHQPGLGPSRSPAFAHIAEEVTAVIRQAMQAPFVVNDQPMQVGISIGVSHYQHDWSPEQWLIQADRAITSDSVTSWWKRTPPLPGPRLRLCCTR